MFVFLASCVLIHQGIDCGVGALLLTRRSLRSKVYGVRYVDAVLIQGVRAMDKARVTNRFNRSVFIWVGRGGFKELGEGGNFCVKEAGKAHAAGRRWALAFGLLAGAVAIYYGVKDGRTKAAGDSVVISGVVCVGRVCVVLRGYVRSVFCLTAQVPVVFRYLRYLRRFRFFF